MVRRNDELAHLRCLVAVELGGWSVDVLGQLLCEALSFRQTPHQRLDVAVIALLPRGLSSA
jgi:hypothetical protein